MRIEHIAMHEKYTPTYIYELLNKANDVDKEYKVFGASKHKYKLNPPASMDEIRALEVELNITFPEEFVYFYTRIGNGGAGPYYGLYSVEEIKRNCEGKQDDNIQPLIDSNLSYATWYKLMKQMEADDDAYDEIYQQVCSGAVIIGTQGCTFDNLLMFKGSEAGKIVYIDWNLDGEYPPVLTGTSFLEWYVNFYEDIIASYSVQHYGYIKRCTEQELIEAYKSSLTYEDKLDNLKGLLRFDRLSDKTINVLYNSQDIDTSVLRLELLLKYHTDLAMKLFDTYIYGQNVSAAIAVMLRIPKGLQQMYYKRAIEILYESTDCVTNTLLFFIGDQKCRKASDIIEFTKNTSIDNELKATTIYVIGKCPDAIDYESHFIKWMKDDNYRVAHTALQASINLNHHSYALMETFRWMEERYKNDRVMQSNLNKVLKH